MSAPESHFSREEVEVAGCCERQSAGRNSSFTTRSALAPLQRQEYAAGHSGAVGFPRNLTRLLLLVLPQAVLSACRRRGIGRERRKGRERRVFWGRGGGRAAVSVHYAPPPRQTILGGAIVEPLLANFQGMGIM